MGLSVAFSGGIILFAMLYTSAVLLSSMGSSTEVFESASERSKLEDSILKTNVKISSITAVAASQDIDFVITNDGTTKLWQYEKFNVLVTYDGSTGKKTEQLSYVETCPPSVGNWCFTQFNNDFLEPKIINSDESAQISVKLADSIDSNGIVTIVFSTEYGVIATKSIQV